MFTTRSTYPPAPVTNHSRAAGGTPTCATCAVLLVGHGSSRQPAAAASLERHADALRALGAFAEVHTAILIGGGTAPADVLRGIDRDAVAIVPMMMCSGWTTRNMIPEALGLGRHGSAGNGRRIVTCQPIGLQPALADLIGKRVIGWATTLGLAADAVTVLLIAHGSMKFSASHDAAELQASRLRATGQFRKVVTSYLEQPPTVSHALETLSGPTAVVGLFAAPGHHATGDVDGILSKLIGREFTNLGPIGDDDDMPALVQNVVEDRLSNPSA